MSHNWTCLKADLYGQQKGSTVQLQQENKQSPAWVEHNDDCNTKRDASLEAMSQLDSESWVQSQRPNAAAKPDYFHHSKHLSLLQLHIVCHLPRCLGCIFIVLVLVSFETSVAMAFV